MQSNALAAVDHLQQRAARFYDMYELERIDRALDEIVENLHRTDPVSFQCRSALANAAKVIRNRRTIRRYDSLDNPLPDGSLPDTGAIQADYAVVDLIRWLDTSPTLGTSERRLLRDLAAGEDAESLARRDDVPLARMRERISRARSTGRSAYQNEVLS
ncbi:hypothetical protein A5746_21690 [Mycolicibacterium conceptionense]|uniref:hypothetical protein n=1 Tax=Mycobacteriaceae TaxID=1762 RepID=UPI00096F7877|nr:MULTISPECIES: hypothetical protein [Mycobacteriaceae]OMB89902.1 hypothetical protein A5746_21690 [Mycolicibacterium conceptionense]SKK26983.1 Uncharacterised protein [Mycobacteroides abscessus subsp. massiliense]